VVVAAGAAPGVGAEGLPSGCAHGDQQAAENGKLTNCHTFPAQKQTRSNSSSSSHAAAAVIFRVKQLTSSVSVGWREYGA
jgi:D-aminopeptidase